MDTERRQALVARLQRLRKERVPFAQSRVQVSRELPEIEAALHRVADDVYGTCVACGMPIAQERLDLLPATPYCVDCAGDTNRRGPTGRHPTLPARRLRGEQVRFVTDTELGDFLLEMLRARSRRDRVPESGTTTEGTSVSASSPRPSALRRLAP